MLHAPVVRVKKHRFKSKEKKIVLKSNIYNAFIAGHFVKGIRN